MQAQTKIAFLKFDNALIGVESLRAACAAAIIEEVGIKPNRADFDTLREEVVKSIAGDGDTGRARKRWFDAVQYARAELTFEIPPEAPKSETAEAKRKAAKRAADAKVLASKTPEQWAREAKAANKAATTSAEIKAAAELAKRAEQAAKAKVAADKAIATAARKAVSEKVNEKATHVAEAVQAATKFTRQDWALVQWVLANKTEVTALMRDLTAQRVEESMVPAQELAKAA